MADDSALVNSLNQRIERLEKELDSTKKEMFSRKKKQAEQRDQIAALTKERDDHAAMVASLTTERDGLKTKLTAAPDEKDKQIADLQLQIRSRIHQDRFDELAEKAGCDKSSLAAAWKLSGYTPEADEADDGALGEAIEAARVALPIAFKPAQSSGQGQSGAGAPKKPPLLPGVGGGRGGASQSGGAFQVRESDMRSPEWMNRNQSRMYEASQAGQLVILEGQ